MSEHYPDVAVVRRQARGDTVEVTLANVREVAGV